jgi:hypothetical protein
MIIRRFAGRDRPLLAGSAKSFNKKDQPFSPVFLPEQNARLFAAAMSGHFAKPI